MVFVKSSTSGDGNVSSGTQAWNSADVFSKSKISSILIRLDDDERVAQFGKRGDEDDVPNEYIPHRRVEYFLMFIFDLKQLIGNCEFAIEKGYDERLIRTFLDRIEQIEEVADGIASTFTNEVTKEEELRINESHFKACFRILQQIKNELNFPLNRASLIFKRSDELNLDEVMRGFEDGG